MREKQLFGSPNFKAEAKKTRMLLCHLEKMALRPTEPDEDNGCLEPHLSRCLTICCEMENAEV
ncbi:unnamed protein product [Dicrocoelium dendriticum]|nr:unnamed protein product [Dicrocoelium dendriticum]